jgi:hypothetical protein
MCDSLMVTQNVETCSSVNYTRKRFCDKYFCDINCVFCWLYRKYKKNYINAVVTDILYFCSAVPVSQWNVIPEGRLLSQSTTCCLRSSLLYVTPLTGSYFLFVGFDGVQDKAAKLQTRLTLGRVIY